MMSVNGTGAFMKKQSTYQVVSNPSPSDAELQVLFAGRSQTKPAHRLGPKVFDYWLIHYVERGRGTFACEGQQFTLGQGDSFFIPPGVLVRYESHEQDPWLYQWIAICGPQADRLLFEVGVTQLSPTIHIEGNPVRQWFDRMRQVLQENAKYVNLKVNAYLQLLIASYGEARMRGEEGTEQQEQPRAQKHPVALVRKAIQYLSTQYAEPITIDMMAENLGYSRAYLSRVFHQHTGVNPVTFLLQLRLDRARRLLRERLELTIEQVASSVGFQDALHFSKQFRRAYGESPSQYRSVFAGQGEYAKS